MPLSPPASAVLRPLGLATLCLLASGQRQHFGQPAGSQSRPAAQHRPSLLSVAHSYLSYSFAWRLAALVQQRVSSSPQPASQTVRLWPALLHAQHRSALDDRASASLPVCAYDAAGRSGVAASRFKWAGQLPNARPAALPHVHMRPCATCCRACTACCRQHGCQLSGCCCHRSEACVASQFSASQLDHRFGAPSPFVAVQTLPAARLTPCHARKASRCFMLLIALLDSVAQLL